MRAAYGVLLLAACATSRGAKEPVPPDQASILLRQADGFFDGRAYVEARETYLMAALAAHNAGDTPRAAEAFAQLAHVLAQQGQPDLARRYWARASALAEEDEPAGWSRLLLARAALERQSVPSRALETYTQLYEYSLARALETRTVQAAYMAGRLASGSERVMWARRALEADCGHDARLTASLHTQQAWALLENEQPDAALPEFERALELARGLDGATRLQAEWALAHALRRSGRMEEARAAARQVVESARERYRQRGLQVDAEWLRRAEAEQALSSGLPSD